MTDMLHKDTQMSNILRRDDMTNDQKQKLYNANLERYLELRQQKDSQIPSVRVVGKKEEQGQQPQQQQQLPDAVVVEPIPKTMRTRATALLNRLKTRPDLVTWDKSRHVKIKGETIPDSNISDLVSHAMRAQKGFNPTGSKAFFQASSKLNVPRDLVRNQERWKEVGETSDVKGFTKSRSTDISDRYPALKLLRSYEKGDTPKRWLNY